jgi:hypothetical protein
MAEHLAFDQLETIDLSFRLSIAPRGGESGAVAFQPGEGFHRGHAAAFLALFSLPLSNVGLTGNRGAIPG